MRNINKYNILKWYKMLTGKSILHVNQGVGKIYDKVEIKGYYNDLTEKVLKDENFNNVEIPKDKLENGEEIIFPVSVFQYGLGAYDLYLMDNQKLYLDKFRATVQWALDNQQEDGSWNNFFFIYPEAPYSAMAQGEGASLLIRAYKEFKENQYLIAAKKAIDFMLISIEDGGTTSYKNGDVFFEEYTQRSTVLNGWIFAIFGLFDYVKISDDEKTKETLEKTLKSMEVHLKDFDNGYWSMYDNAGIITSPFYHNLHIAQLNALYDLFEKEIFREYKDKWSLYRKKWINRKRAFLVKVFQKLTENK